MQAVAAWLVARPLNAVLGLAATISLAWLSFLSGVVMVLLVLHKGPQRAFVDVLMASVVLGIVGVLVKAPLLSVFVNAMTMWLPAMLFGVGLIVTRSLTLTVQMSVIVAIAAMLGFYAFTADPIAFWYPFLDLMSEVWREMGSPDVAQAIARDRDEWAARLPMTMTVAAWMLLTVNCILGYLLYRQLPGETVDCGEFRDLNFGRVLAISMAVAALVALLSGAVWVQNISLVLFTVFFLQGLAVLHWLYSKGQLPVFGIIVVYVLMPILHVLLLMGLAVFGYIDAWFRLRRDKVKPIDQ